MIKTVWSITFHVSNLEKAAKFYEETLGLEKKYEYSSYVGFECGGVEIGLTPKLKEGQKVSTASPSVEFLVDDVEKVYRELKNKRGKVHQRTARRTLGRKTSNLHRPRRQHPRNNTDKLEKVLHRIS